MKTLVIIFLFAISSLTVNAQNIVFDGTVFKNKLLTSSTSNSVARDINNNNLQIDADNDGEITALEASTVYKLEVQQSSITNLTGLEYFINVTELNCSHNDFATIDVSALTQLSNLDVSNNNSLISIYAKNGSNEIISFGSNTPLVTYICADESQVSALLSSGNGLTGYIVNSYCTISPGGNHNEITGQILFDADNDGPITPDAPFPNIKLKTTISSNTIQTVSDAAGDYTFYTTNTGNYTVTPAIENESWFTFTPASGNFADTNNNSATHNFLIAPNGVHNDVEVVITPVSYPVVGSGSDVVYDVVYKNKGNQSHSGQVSLTYNQSQLNFISSTVTLNDSGTGTLTLPYTNLLPFESRTFRITFTLNASVIADDIVQLHPTIDTTNEDMTTQEDNSFIYNQKALSTANTNSIDCLEGSLLPPADAGKYLHYAINFENTGNQDATNVTVKTDFDPTKYDISSLQVLNSTYPVTLEVINNSVFYKIRNTHVGGPGGQGGILLKVKSLPTLPAGSTVNSAAEIFFDYGTTINPLDVITANASTTYQNLSNSIHQYDDTIRMYPNPTSSYITVEGINAIRTVALYDITGRLLQTNITNDTKVVFDISERAAGVYFLKITSDKGQNVEKIMKK